jgi:hypothetical protein
LQEELDVLLMQLEQLAQRDEALLLPLFHPRCPADNGSAAPDGARSSQSY